MAMESLQDLYVTKLQMIYDAEQQGIDAMHDAEQKGLDAMERMAAAASNPQVKQAFETHRAQTQQHVQRLEQVFERLGESAEAKKCISLRALVEEAETQLGKIDDESTRDAFLIAAQQAVEHHEMAEYGTARTWARQLGYNDAAMLLQQTLDEEEQADRLLTQIAERMVNPQAAQGDSAQIDREVARTATAGDRASSDLGGAMGGRATGNAADLRP
jgi:ferritin-like metal-binding protein YciE